MKHDPVSVGGCVCMCASVHVCDMPGAFLPRPREAST